MEIQNIFDYCLNCSNMLELVNKRKQGIDIDSSEVYDIRCICANCRTFGRTGIYKADAIISALELYQKQPTAIPNKNVGKKATREKTFGTAVRNLKADGKSIRQIAKILGISVDTVQKILKNIDLDSKTVQKIK